MTRLISRRTLLSTAIAASVGGYAYHRGLRYPTLSLEPRGPLTSFDHAGLSWQFTDCFKTAHKEFTVRAYAPEPKITLRAATDTVVQFTFNNLSIESSLQSEHAEISEQIDGINRVVTVNLKANQPVHIEWAFAHSSDYTFASIGDSGGAGELSWCLQRAHQLGAQFLLHLGDFYYQEGDYESAIDLFYNAPLPCYVAIGNHDFHDGGLLHSQFTDYIGPFNHAFMIGSTRFLNLDTAANFLPRSSGKRGRLVKSLLTQSKQPLTVAYSHKPLHDPTGESTHDIGHEGERDWLIGALKSLNAPTLLSGHIHIFDRSEFAGIDNIIVGQGLGHQDLLTNDVAYSKMAIGHVDAQGHVDYSFESLNMPMIQHCHPRIEPVKASLRNGSDARAKTVALIDKACL